MPHTRIWDEGNPPGSQAAALGATRIRDMKVDITERMAIDHYWDVDQNTDGWHKQVTLPELGADPAAVANQGFVYTKDNAGITDLYYRDSAGTVYRLSGALTGVTLDWGSVTDVPGTILDIEALADPGEDAYLIWDEASNSIIFQPISESAEFAGFIDGSAGAGVTGVFNTSATGWSVAQVAGGRFEITHSLNLAAVTDLAVTANVRLNAGGTDDRYCVVTNETVNSFQILVNDVGAGAVDDDFYFKASRLV